MTHHDGAYLGIGRNEISQAASCVEECKLNERWRVWRVGASSFVVSLACVLVNLDGLLSRVVLFDLERRFAGQPHLGLMSDQHEHANKGSTGKDVVEGGLHDWDWSR